MRTGKKRERHAVNPAHPSLPNRISAFLQDATNTFSHTTLQKRNATHPANTPLFSVIIPTYNGEHHITKTLDSVWQQALHDATYEVIVVNDGSDDRTESAVMHYFTNNPPPLPRTLITTPPNPAPAVARNIGILSARGTYLAFTDDDCIVPKNWLANFYETFRRHPTIQGVGGWKRPYTEHGRAVSRYDVFIFLSRWPYMRNEAMGHALTQFNNCGDTANVCYTKHAVRTVGGFNPAFRYLEDWEMKMRMHKAAYPLLYQPLMVDHISDSSLIQFARHHLMHGREAALISRLHPLAASLHITFQKALARCKSDIDRMPHNTPSKTLMGTVWRPHEYVALIYMKYFLLFLGALSAVAVRFPTGPSETDNIVSL